MRYYVNLPPENQELKKEIQRQLAKIKCVWQSKEPYDACNSTGYSFAPNDWLRHATSDGFYERYPNEFQKVSMEELLQIVETYQKEKVEKYKGRFWIAIPHKELEAPIQSLLHQLQCKWRPSGDTFNVITAGGNTISFEVGKYLDWASKEWYLRAGHYGPKREKTIEQLEEMVSELGNQT